jgi:hypothetical protein
MNTNSMTRWGWAAGLVSILLAGCGPGSSGTIPVSGKITKGGQPLAGALVTFQPNAADGKAASGTTDSAGVYKLTTLVNGDGALPGSYKVTVTKFAGGAAPAGGPSTGATATPADIDAAYKAAESKGQNVMNPGASKAPTDTPSEIDAKFASGDTSGLTADVKSGSQTFDFEVTGK